MRWSHSPEPRSTLRFPPGSSLRKPRVSSERPQHLRLRVPQPSALEISEVATTNFQRSVHGRLDRNVLTAGCIRCGAKRSNNRAQAFVSWTKDAWRGGRCGVPGEDARAAARRPTAFEAAVPGGNRSGESGSGDCSDEHPQRNAAAPDQRAGDPSPQENETRGDYLPILRSSTIRQRS